MPQLVDPNFRRSVVLLCEHSPGGALGLVLNRKTDTAASAVVRLDPPVTRDSAPGMPTPTEPGPASFTKDRTA